MDKKKIVFHKLTRDATPPQKAKKNAAGYDIFSAEDVTIDDNCPKKIGTRISVSFPSGFFGKIETRSGQCREKGLRVDAGVIDSDYTGELFILLSKTSPKKADIIIKKGERIAQLIVHKECTFETKVVYHPPCDEKKTTDEHRGCLGFGSTGDGPL